MSKPTDFTPSVDKGFLLRRIHWRRLVIASLGALVVLAVMFLRVMTVHENSHQNPSYWDSRSGLTDFCRWSTWPFDSYDLFQNGGPGLCWVPMWLGQGLVCGLIIERCLPGIKLLCRAIRITTENAVGLAAIAGLSTFMVCLKFLNADDPMHGVFVGIALSIGLHWGILCYSPLCAITGKVRRVVALFALACVICGAMLPLLLWCDCILVLARWI